MLNKQITNNTQQHTTHTCKHTLNTTITATIYQTNSTTLYTHIQPQQLTCVCLKTNIYIQMKTNIQLTLIKQTTTTQDKHIHTPTTHEHNQLTY
jgi:hypothetical protein